MNIPQEYNLPVVIRFTRTSPSFSRQERIDALEGLVDRCSRAINTCLEASREAMVTVALGTRHRASLNSMSDLPANLQRQLVQLTEQLEAASRLEVDAIEQNLRSLGACKMEAEQGRECCFSPTLLE